MKDFSLIVLSADGAGRFRPKIVNKTKALSSGIRTDGETRRIEKVKANFLGTK